MNTIIYTDGACKYNPGPGGWGCIVNGKELSGGFRHTTNNRMELMAVIKGLSETSPNESDAVYEKEQGESPSFTSMEDAESPRKEKNDDIISILSSAFGTSITGLFLDTIAKNGYELKKKD